MRKVVAALVLAAATLGVWLLAAYPASAAPSPGPQPTRSAAPATPSPPVPTPVPTPGPTSPRQPPSRSPLDRLGDAATGTTADLQCKRPPAPGKPDEGLAGWIDARPSQLGSGYYSTYGYGGWLPVIYDPGCPISLDGLRGAEARIFDGRNETAALYMQAQLAAVSLAVEAANIVFAQDGIWALLTPVTAFLRWSVGARWWVLFGALALAATGLYWLVRARRGDVAEASAASARSAIILAVGGACLATTVTAGALVSQGVSAFYGAMSDATTQSAPEGAAVVPATTPATAAPGATPAQVPAGTADAVLGDMLMANVVYPSWAMLHFGNDQRAAAQFGPRLFAAGAMTREEAARAAQDPAYASSITATKKADYARVAGEYQAAFPDTYGRYLAGNDTSGRPSAALAGLLGCIPIVVFLVWSLWWMGTLRIVIDLALALAPAGALIAQFPRAQWLAGALVKWLTVYLLTAAVATTLFVVFVAGGVGGILGANAATSSKVIAMFVLLLLGRAVWKRRKLLTERTGVSKDSERVAVAMEALREEYRTARTPRSRLTGDTGALPVAGVAGVAGVAAGAAVGAAAPVALTDAEPRRLSRHDESGRADNARVSEQSHTAGGDGLSSGDGLSGGSALTSWEPAAAASPATAAAAGSGTASFGAGGVPFDSFDEAARNRAAQRIAAARAANSGVPAPGSAREQLERPRRLDPLDWPTDRHAPNVAEVPDSPESLATAGHAAPNRLRETPADMANTTAGTDETDAALATVRREVSAHADVPRRI